MSKLKILIPALILLAALPAVSQAQTSVPFATATYHVQVKKEMWRNGSTYWSTVFSTENADDADLMYELLDSALENGTICQILNCGFDWIIRDVRIVTEWEFPYLDIRQSKLKPQSWYYP